MICSRSPPGTLTKRQHHSQKQPCGSAPPHRLRLGQAATSLGTGKRELGRGNCSSRQQGEGRLHREKYNINAFPLENY